MSLEKFNVVPVATLRPKEKHTSTLREVRHGSFPVFVLNVHLSKELVTYLESRISLFFPLA